MPLTDAGVTEIAKMIIDDSPTHYTNAVSYLGVGEDNTAFSAAHTDLQGASKNRVAMDATFPSRSTDVLTFQSTWGTGAGNHVWAEWGVFNHASAGTMLTRKVEALGTKTSAQSWELNVDLTVDQV